MEKLEKALLILGIIIMVNFIMFFMGVFSRMATEGFSLNILIEIFPINKLIMVIISFSAYFIVKYERSKKRK